MNNNLEYLHRLNRLGLRESVFRMGDPVRDRQGRVGLIDSLYACYEAAVAQGVVPREWYERLALTPKTTKDGLWYGVIHVEGSTLAGEQDLEHSTFADVFGEFQA